MADTAGQQDIRGIDVQKFVTGFADEDVVLKKYTRLGKTTAREIRWFQKTAGYVSPATTTGITANLIANTASKAVGPVAYQSWTRNTSYIRKYMVESETISAEDEQDTDVDVLMTMVRDLLISVASQVDTRIFNVLTEDLTPVNILTTASVQDGWDDLATGNPIQDLLVAQQKIRAQRYNPKGCIFYMNSIEHRHLINYLISVKGSSIPQFASEQLGKTVIMEILGGHVVVSENATSDYVLTFLPNKSVAWKQFMPLTSAVINDPGVGKKLRIWEEGEALLEHPKSVHLTTDTIT